MEKHTAFYTMFWRNCMNNTKAFFNNILFDDLFNGFGGTVKIFTNEFSKTPHADVSQTQDFYLIDVEVPGFDESNIDVQLEGRTLTISSKTEDATTETSDEKKEVQFLLRERSEIKFSRSFTLPEDSDLENVSAECKKGVLRIQVPRTPESKPRRIAISSLEAKAV